MNVTLWLTDRCNLRCKYCYENDTHSIHDMTSEIACQAVNFMKKQLFITNEKILKVFFHGGEPLLNYEVIPQIIEMINASINSKVKIIYGITTNGTIINDNIIDYLTANINKLSVSLDGSKETHDKYRVTSTGHSVYEEAIKFFQAARRNRSDVCARMTYRADTVSSLFNNVVHLYNQGALIIHPAPDLYDSQWSKTAIDIAFINFRKLKKFIAQHNDLKIIPLVDNERHTLMGTCDGGVTSFNILPNGDLYPCTYSTNNHDLCCGNVWDGVNVQSVSKIAAISNNKNLDCVGCSHINSCRSTKCKLVNLALTGDPNLPSAIYCAFERGFVTLDLEEW